MTKLADIAREQLTGLQQVEPDIDENGFIMSGDLYIGNTKIKNPKGVGFPISFYIDELGLRCIDLKAASSLFGANAYLINHFYNTESGAMHSCVQFLKLPKKYMINKYKLAGNIQPLKFPVLHDKDDLLRKVRKELGDLFDVQPHIEQGELVDLKLSIYDNEIEIKNPRLRGFPISFYTDYNGVKVDGIRNPQRPSENLSLKEIALKFGNVNAYILSQNSYHLDGGEINTSIQFLNLPKKIH